MLALVAVVAAILVHDDASDQPAVMESVALLSLEELPRNLVDRIEVQREDDEVLVFGREDGQWWLVEPFRHRMRNAAMVSLVEGGLATQVVDKLDGVDASNLSRFELAPPRGSISYQWEGGEMSIDLGRSGIGGRSYMRLGGAGPVLVVNDVLQQRLLGVDPVQWRDRTLFPGMNIEIDRIERIVGDNHVVLERDGRAWNFKSPIQSRIDEEAMGNFVINLARAEWGDVLLDQPESAASFGLDPPAARLLITGKDLQRTLLIGNQLGGDTLARAGMIEGIPVVVKLDEETVGTIFPNPTELLDYRASGIHPADVKSIEIVGLGGEFRLERSLDHWISPDNDGREVPTQLVEELLNALTTLRATELEVRDVYPVELERARVTLLGFDGSPIDTVRLLREEVDSGRWGMENGDRVIRIHPEFVVLHLLPGDYGLPAPTP